MKYHTLNTNDDEGWYLAEDLETALKLLDKEAEKFISTGHKVRKQTKEELPDEMLAGYMVESLDGEFLFFLQVKEWGGWYLALQLRFLTTSTNLHSITSRPITEIGRYSIVQKRKKAPSCKEGAVCCR